MHGFDTCVSLLRLPSALHELCSQSNFVNFIPVKYHRQFRRYMNIFRVSIYFCTLWSFSYHHKTIQAIGVCILKWNSNLHLTKKLIDSAREVVNVIKIRGIHLVCCVHSNTTTIQSWFCCRNSCNSKFINKWTRPENIVFRWLCVDLF